MNYQLPSRPPAQTLARTLACGVALLGTLCGPAGILAQDQPPTTAPTRQGAKPSTGGDVVAVPQLRERAAAMLVEFASTGTPEQRANALEALLPVPARLEQVVRAALRSPNPGVRSVAAMTVGKAKLDRVAESLRPLQTDQSQIVRASAIFGLVRTGARVDPSPLAAMLMDEQVAVRAQAAFILGELGNNSAVPMLIEASGAPAGRADPIRDRLMRLQIAEALVKLRYEQAIHEIRAALYPARPEDLEAATLAVQILGQIKDQASKAQLRILLRENYDNRTPMPVEIRLAAATGLARMGEVQFATLALTYLTSTIATQRAQAAIVLGESGEKAYLPKLAALLDDPEPLVRIAAGAGILKITEGEGRGRQ
ncbi:MAG: HEAT repeat domain-containing protein [Phycisphaeraceae bacterium]|nr:HEAT repeat domain-containing protein [Phycisphaeraceae bacterium]